DPATVQESGTLNGCSGSSNAAPPSDVNSIGPAIDGSVDPLTSGLRSGRMLQRSLWSPSRRHRYAKWALAIIVVTTVLCVTALVVQPQQDKFEEQLRRNGVILKRVSLETTFLGKWLPRRVKLQIGPVIQCDLSPSIGSTLDLSSVARYRQIRVRRY